MSQLDDLIKKIIRDINDLKDRVNTLTKIDGPAKTWTDWTPTVTQSGDVTFTTTYCQYLLVGKLAHVRGQLTITGSGTTANAIVIGNIPSAVAPLDVGSYSLVGVGYVRKAGVDRYTGGLHAESSSTFRIYLNAAGGNPIGINPNIALANGDVISFSAAYRIA